MACGTLSVSLHHESGFKYSQWHLLPYTCTAELKLDPFVINCLYILEWFKSLRPFSCLLRPLQICKHFDWLK